MRTRSGYRDFLALVLLLLLAACGGASENRDATEDTPDPLTGVISTIEPAEGPIESFELVRPGQEAQRILIDSELDYGFDLQHLHEHADGALPVTVTLEERDGQLYATSIEDV